MTVESLVVPLLRENLLHFLGYRGRGTPSPRIEALLEPAVAEAWSLIAPRGVHRVVPRERAALLGLAAGSGACLAIGLVTIGPALERRVSELLALGQETRALLLDAAGSAAVEEAAEDLERRIHERGEAPARARPASRRVSPGYGSWPVTAQRALFEMLPHGEIGVSLLPSCLMSPRKSVSFAVWLEAAVGAGGTEDAAGAAGTAEAAGAPAASGDACEPCGPGRCASCDLTTCPYREAPDEAETP